jgi:hypothetical protein
MARTVRTKVYKFNELSSTAQSVAIECQRDRQSTEFIYEDAHSTVKAFSKVFGLRGGRNSFLAYTHTFDDNTTSLKGLRLRTYIINNFEAYLYKGKYYSLWSKTEVTYKHHTNGHPVLKTRYSKVMLEHSCVLTGMCYDDSMLQPVYDLIHNYSPKQHDTMNIEDLMDECFDSLKTDLDKEEEAMNEDKYLIGEIEDLGLEFYESGKIYA